MPAAPRPPLGTVIEDASGAHSIWNGKAFVPARQAQDGTWGVDNEALTHMGLGGTSGAGPLSPEDQKRVAAMQGDFDQVDALDNNAHAFMSLNQRTPTGGLLAIPGATTIAKAIPGTSPDLSTMDRIGATMATQMRQPGMRLTQMEFGKFLGAVPSPRANFANNQGVTHNIDSAKTYAAAKASFYSTWLNVHRTLAGADAAWLKWRNQHFSPDLSTYSHDPLPQAPAAPPDAANDPAAYHAYLQQKFAQ